MVCITCPVLKHPCLLSKNPTSRFSTRISRPYSVLCCQGNGACLNKGEGFQKEQRNHKLSSLLVAGIISIASISATQESLAQTLGSQKGGAIFQKACIGCHYEGGNILQSGATLTIRDLERNGVATVEDIFNLTYYGKARMPGFGEKCTPRGQCTFGPRLSDEDIRLLAEYVKAQADQDDILK
ncbi:hypothetical protein SUGI_0121690 [Cryptomeria japonica]|nr:hypothetical protein SUGI_0121690 [Cryptomeria japonica]